MRNKVGAPIMWVERALLALGIVCLGYYGYISAEARHFQREQAAAFEARLAGLSTSIASSAPAAPSVPAVVGVLDIPRLNISTPVLSGDEDDTLDLAVGHLPDTPLPWERGNSALAGHRDGLFRPLRDVRIGDEIRVRTSKGDFTYTVRETKIVKPSDLSVLAPSGEFTLTLITCYPFNFIGSAPKRFIVHAERVPSGTQ